MERVHVLEGGLDRWKAEGGEVAGGPATIQVYSSSKRIIDCTQFRQQLGSKKRYETWHCSNDRKLLKEEYREFLANKDLYVGW